MDKSYWNNIYVNEVVTTNRSPFAKFCYDNFLSENDLLIDLGCGNGRDSIFFFKNKLNVVSIDQSLKKNLILNKIQSNENNTKNKISFFKDDFIKFDYKKINEINVFYSRWTIHSISKKQEDKLFAVIEKNLNTSGYFCIEVRTINDPLFGQGTFVEKNAYFTDHYRRFIDPADIKNTIIKHGFEILFFEESNLFSPSKEDNPVLLRAIVKKT